jgi:hypothetical protein
LGAPWGFSFIDPIPFLFTERARRKLRERAEKNLAVKLERAIDPVPCPHCGMLQPNMPRPKKRKRHEMAKTIMLLIGIVLTAIALAVYRARTGR